MFEFNIPDLSKFDFTDKELAVARKYTRIRECVVDGWPDAHTTWLAVGSQHFAFGVGAHESAEEASLHCWMLAKALLNILSEQRGAGVIIPFSAASAVANR
jgi:hypothetical protein